MAEYRLQYRGTLFPIRGGEVSLGRSSYSSIVVNNPLASREHALVRFDGARLEVVDLDSKNGTFVNGERISGACPLDVGDRIKVGTDVIEVARVSAPDPRASRVATEPGVREGIQVVPVPVPVEPEREGETTVNFRRSLELVESMVENCRTESSRPGTADAVIQVLDEFVADVGGVRLGPSEVERVREVARVLSSWNLGSYVEEWRESLEARLGAGPTLAPP